MINLAPPETKFVVGKFAKQLGLPFDDCEVKGGRFWAVTRTVPSVDKPTETTTENNKSLDSTSKKLESGDKMDSSTSKNASGGGVDGGLQFIEGEDEEGWEEEEDEGEGWEEEEEEEEGGGVKAEPPAARKPPVNRGFLGDDEADTLSRGRGQSAVAGGTSDAFLGRDGGVVGGVSSSGVPLNLEDSYWDEEEQGGGEEEEQWEVEGGTVAAAAAAAGSFEGASPRAGKVFEVPGGIAVANRRSVDGEEGWDEDGEGEEGALRIIISAFLKRNH